ncbi:hypothetical protein WN982_37130 [Paraburkholderia sp. IMGN_8]|uniref:hypothetical protein n=1 Tax=Paraburkholderia sp. IMGN_8 TaxID=3136564 RepID=UPI003100BFB7
MQAIAAQRGGKCVSTAYVNANTRLEWEYAEGHRWLAVPNSVKRGTWCRVCAVKSTRRSLADAQRAAAGLGGRCLSSEYFNGTTPLWFECADGHRWQTTPATVFAGHWCQLCWDRRRRHTIEQMRELAASRGGQCLSGDYLNQHQPLRWRCAQGHEWESKAAIVKGHWCPQCQREQSRTGIGRMREIAAERGGQCLSDRYVNAHAYLQWRCARGHTWEAASTRIQQGQWCPYCSGRRYSLADMQALAHTRGGECLSDSYLTVQEKLRWRCGQRHVWEATPALVVTGSWCPQCRHERKQTRDMERMHELAALRGGRCLSEGYQGAATPLEWQCSEGHVWQQAPRLMIQRGWWCPYCSGRRKYTLADMKAIAQARGGDCLSETFRSSHDRLQWRCARGHDWTAKAWNVVSGRWCPSCAHLDRIRAKNGWKRRRYEAWGKLRDPHGLDR